MENYLEGNLITMAKNGDFDIIIHGQNCFHGWSKGFALELSKCFKGAKKADLATKKGDKNKLGTYSYSIEKLENGKELIVINAYTQFSYGGQKKVHFVYAAFEQILEKIAKDFPDKTIAYPKIGAGLAGGDWLRILYSINLYFKSFDHTLVVYKK